MRTGSQLQSSRTGYRYERNKRSNARPVSGLAGWRLLPMANCSGPLNRVSNTKSPVGRPTGRQRRTPTSAPFGQVADPQGRGVADQQAVKPMKARVSTARIKAASASGSEDAA
jgi:hypothetical protein